MIFSWYLWDAVDQIFVWKFLQAIHDSSLPNLKYKMEKEK